MTSMSTMLTALLVLYKVLIGGNGPIDPNAMDKALVVAQAHLACRTLLKNDELNEGGPIDYYHFAKEIISNGKLATDGDSSETVQSILKRVNVNDASTLFLAVCGEPNTIDMAKIPDEAVFAAKKEFFELLASLPDAATLRQRLRKENLPQSTMITSADGKVVGEWSDFGGKRTVVNTMTLPAHVYNAWIAAEDKNFRQHNGVDASAITRAVIKVFLKDGRPQGGSTITQQLAKNLVVGDDVSITRKMKEWLTAVEIERHFTKSQILDIYLNYIFLGRNAYGIEAAAQAYFNKSANRLSIAETALLTGITHGPNSYDLDADPNAGKERRQYVLERMLSDNLITRGAYEISHNSELGVVPFANPNDRVAPYFAKKLLAEADNFFPGQNFVNKGYRIESTIDTEIQSWAARALQDGLFKYEATKGRNEWRGPIANRIKDLEAAEAKAAAKAEAEAIEAAKPKVSFSALAGLSSAKPTEPEPETAPILPPWQKILNRQWNPIKDVHHWQLAIVQSAAKKGNQLAEIGMIDGTEGILANEIIPGTKRGYIGGAINLRRGDIIVVEKSEEETYYLRQIPEVQGAITVVDNRTGAIKAMQGGFSYGVSDFNRAVFSFRQPGSLLKPFTYLAAYQAGMQPNVLIDDRNVTFPPITGQGKSWRPKNYDHTEWGPTRIGIGLSKSRNLMTAQLMRFVGLDSIRDITQELGLYDEPVREYPLIIGAQGTSVLRAAIAFAQIANGGRKLHGATWFKQILGAGDEVLVGEPIEPQNLTDRHFLKSVDAITLYQVANDLQSVVTSGTAASQRKYANFLAGKTGTTDDYQDSWFAGFTKEITVAVWVGYDNGSGAPKRYLGKSSTGSELALPIAASVVAQSLKKHGYIDDAGRETDIAISGYINIDPPPGIVFDYIQSKTGALVDKTYPDAMVAPFRMGFVAESRFAIALGYGQEPLIPQLARNTVGISNSNFSVLQNMVSIPYFPDGGDLEYPNEESDLESGGLY